jgi:cysteine synthase
VNPAKSKLIRMTPRLPRELNPFADDGVSIVGAMMYGGGASNKVAPGWQLVYDGIESGEITQGTTVVVASSGQTALVIATLCKMLGLKCLVIMSSDVPSPKVEAITSLGIPIEVRLISTNTIEYARALGAQPGYFDTDQYLRAGNITGQARFMAPQLLTEHGGPISVVYVATGTIGTGGGIKKRLLTKVVIGVCKEGEEVPAGRTESSIRKDVRTASLDEFDGLEAVGRHVSFLSAYSLWRLVPWSPPGPSSGLALAVALQNLRRHKRANTLDTLRGPDGRIYVVFMCPDDNKSYLPLFKAELHLTKDFAAMEIGYERILELLS